jgi:hypothetical protein
MKLVKEVYHSWGAEGLSYHGMLPGGWLTPDVSSPSQLFSSRQTTAEIRKLCKGARKQVFRHSGLCGTL